MGKSKNALKKLSKIMELQKKQYPDVAERFFTNESGKLVENIVRLTPVDTGRLRGAWRLNPVKKEDGAWVLSCSNNVEYAMFVEYGHRWVRRGWQSIKLENYNPKTDKTGFTKPRFMARDGVEKTNKELQSDWAHHIENWLKRFENLK